MQVLGRPSGAGPARSRHHLLTSPPIRVDYGQGVYFRRMAGDSNRKFIRGASWTLKRGMVFHMLTRAHRIDFNETGLVTDNRHEVLTRFPRESFQR